MKELEILVGILYKINKQHFIIIIYNDGRIIYDILEIELNILRNGRVIHGLV
jgi:archaellum component FlaF (FlaF/FlaG flagellin family)